MKITMLVGIGVGVLLSSIFIGSMEESYGLIQDIFGYSNKGDSSTIYNSDKVAYIEHSLNKYYIEDMKETDMLEGIYKGYVYGVGDTYTSYLTAEEFAKEMAEAQGGYIGTGVHFAWGITNQHIIVTEVVIGSPAYREGIRVGDKIVAIDGMLAMASNETEVYEKLMYTGGEPVTYTIVSNDESQQREVKLTAEFVEVELITSKMQEDTIGYVEMDGLVEGSVEALVPQLEQLREEGASSFILDLRDTYSYAIDEVLKLCDIFLDEQVAFTVKNNKDEHIPYHTTDGSYKEDIVILTSKDTEGAIEGFVLAMEESERATIVGEKSKGNGTVQEKIALEDGSGLIITTGLIETKNGDVIKGNGVEPDIIQRTTLENALTLVTKGYISDDEDDVLQKAIEVLTK